MWAVTVSDVTSAFSMQPLLPLYPRHHEGRHEFSTVFFFFVLRCAPLRSAPWRGITPAYCEYSPATQMPSQTCPAFMSLEVTNG